MLTEHEQMLAALQAAKKLFDEALPKFNWGASALDANAVTLLNTVPSRVAAAITRATTDPYAELLQVVQAREDRMDRLVAFSPKLLEAVREAAAKFRHYEALHLAKGTDDSRAKAAVNGELASRFEVLVARAAGELTVDQQAAVDETAGL